MSDQTDSIINQLKTLGLSLDEARIYCQLAKNDSQSALELCRSLKIARTRVYRLLDILISRGIVRELRGARGLRFETDGSASLKRLLFFKEQEVETLQKTIPGIITAIDALSSLREKESKIVHYRGIQGLEQVTWNSLQAHDTLRLFELSTMSEYLDRGFAESVRVEFVKRKIHAREIVSKTHIPAWTDVSEFAMHFWECRYIDPQKIAVQFETLVYNDVLAAYGYENDEIFCVEIYNPKLAALHKQLFDFVWEHALPMKKIGEQGEVSTAL